MVQQRLHCYGSARRDLLVVVDIASGRQRRVLGADHSTQPEKGLAKTIASLDAPPVIPSMPLPRWRSYLFVPSPTPVG